MRGQVGPNPAVWFLGAAIMTVVAFVASFFGSLFLGALSVVGGPIVAGVIVASKVRRTLPAALVSAAVAGAAAFAAQRAVLSGLLTQPMVDASSMLALGAGASLAVAGLLAALAGGFAARAFVASPKHPAFAHAVAVATIVMVAIGMFGSANSVGPSAVNNVVAEPGSYAYDAAIYWQTHRLMVERDFGYYDAFIEAASGDSRLMEEGCVVDGKFRAWATSPSYMRLPFIFWVWQGADAVGIDAFKLSMLVASALLLGAYWAFWPRLGHAAVAIPLLLYPWFIMHTISVNLFFPDLWAGMFALGSMLLAIREKWLLAGVLALAAALCREVATIWLVFLAFGAVVALVSGPSRSARRDILAYAAMIGVLALAVWLHRAPASAKIVAGTVELPVIDMLVWSAKRPLADKFLVPGAYTMYLYGSYRLPTAVLTLLAPAGFWLALRRADRRVVATVLAAAAFWPLFTLVIGAPSDYWGQHYTAFALVGCIALALGLAGASGPEKLGVSTSPQARQAAD